MDSSKKIKDLTFCALDLETTGANPLYDRIIEIGAIRFNLKKDLKSFNTLINPQMQIPDSTIKIHGITNEEVKDAPTIEEILPKLLDFINEDILIIQNSRFDLSFIESNINQLNLSSKHFYSFDTVKMSQKAFPDFENHKLGTLCKELQIKHHYHRALSDANGCKEIFKYIINNNDQKQEWTISNLINYHGAICESPFLKKLKPKTFLEKELFQHEKVIIQYQKKSGEISIREIKPLKIFKKGKCRYLYAFCYLRNEYRYFKLANIKLV